MKKTRSIVVLLVTLCIFCSSCATVFGGRVNTYQRTKPLPGQPQRRLRVGAFIADLVLFWPGAIIDFATAAIYRPTPAPADPADSAPATTTTQSGTNQ